MMTSLGSPSVIIPTLDAAESLPALLDSLLAQTLLPMEILVIDSSSEDDTVVQARRSGCRIEIIARDKFNHGATRNHAARLARGEILVFLTQDALPSGPDFLSNLLQPIYAGLAVATTARQIPNDKASPLEVFSRLFTYPEESQNRDLNRTSDLGIMTYYFSNAGAAIQRGVFESIGGFPEGLIVNEDMLFCARLIKAGYRVAYQADAVIIHSHNYSLLEQFQRYFDIGHFFTQAGDEITGTQLGSRGYQFAVNQIRYLSLTRRWHWIPRSLLESLNKVVAFSMGRRADHLPSFVRKRFSRQKAYWD